MSNGWCPWFINDYYESSRGEDWPQQVCQEWYDIDIDWGVDQLGRDWRDDLEACPTTVHHAHADVGRFAWLLFIHSRT